NFAEHQIANDNFAGTDQRSQVVYMGRIAPFENVDPDRRIDNDHPTPRPLRLRSRLPCQRYLPNAASKAAFCRRSLIIRRRASSTVAFLVGCPDAFWAALMRASSISMFVRIELDDDVCIN